MRPGEAPGATPTTRAPDVSPWNGAGGRGRRQRRRQADRHWPELVMISAVAVIVAAVILAVTSADRANPAKSLIFVEHAGPQHRLPHNKHDSSAHLLGPALKVVDNCHAQPRRRGPRTTTAAARRGGDLLVTAGVENSLTRSWLATNPGGVDLGSRMLPGHSPARSTVRPRRGRSGHLLGAGRVQAFSHVARGIFDGGRAGEAGRVPEQRLCLLLEVGTGLDAPGRSQRRQLPGGRPCAGP